MLANSYGTPFWRGPRGQAMGSMRARLARLSGLGDDTVTLDPSVLTSDPNVPIIETSYPGLNPITNPSVNWLQAVQTGVQDAFQFTKLLNPVPPGTVMQTGPNGTYIARAASGGSFPGLPLGPLGTTGLGPILVIGGLGLAAFAILGGRR